jgi:hypothetical protein
MIEIPSRGKLSEFFAMSPARDRLEVREIRVECEC